MSVIGLRVGAFEIVGSTYVPEPGSWHLARRTGTTRRQPQEALIRLLPPDADADSREALHRQFEVMRALEDARIPEALAFYEGLGALAITAVHGVSLHDVVVGRQGDVIGMSPTTLVDILVELADTLQRAHHRNRFHGGMSPDRVLLAADGRLWIFGFGEPLGTTPNPLWICPERRRGEPVNATTDQWHLGALGAGLISGKTPFTADGQDQLEAMIEPVERQWPALGRLFRQLTESDPGSRFPSMHPVRQELLALARKAGGTSGRRELGADLARPRAIHIDPGDEPAVRVPKAVPPEPDPPAIEAHEHPPDGFSPTTTPPPPPPLPEELPTPDVDVDLTISEEFEAPGRRPFPDEAFVVVRPDVGTEVPLASVSDSPSTTPSSPGVHGLGAPLPPPDPAMTHPPTPQPPMPQPAQFPEAPLQAGVVVEATDPDARDVASAFEESGDGATDAIQKALRSAIEDDDVDAAMQLANAIQADSADAHSPAEGMSWNDLAREFATEAGVGGADTAIPPSIPSSPSGHGAAFIDPSAERHHDDDNNRDDDDSAETEHTNPEVLSGPGSEDSLGIGSLGEDGEPMIQSSRDGIANPQAPSPVPTQALVGRIAPIALGVFLLLWALWFVSRFF